MLLKYFNGNRISIIIFISLLPVVYWIPSLVRLPSVDLVASAGVPFGRMILSFNRDHRIIASLIALVLIIVNANLLIQLNTINIFIPVRTHLPSLFYVILTISLNQLHQLTPALVSSSLLILVFYRIFNAYKVDGISINFLDAGLLISVASLIYFPVLAFFLFLLAGMVVLRPFIWREWIFSIVGLVLPYFFLISVFYLADMSVKDLFRDISDTLIKSPQDFRLSQIVNWSYVLLFILTGSYLMIISFDNMKIHARKFFVVFLLFFLFSLAVFLFVPGAGSGSVYYISIPLAFLFSFYFTRCKRNWINELCLAAFLLLLLWQRIH